MSAAPMTHARLASLLRGRSASAQSHTGPLVFLRLSATNKVSHVVVLAALP